MTDHHPDRSELGPDLAPLRFSARHTGDGCHVPDHVPVVPLEQRVDLVRLAEWNAANEAARVEYRRRPSHFSGWPI